MKYSTSDIVLASTLVVNNHKLQSITVSGVHGTFHFEDVSAEFIESYNLDKITVNPIRFNHAVKQLTTAVRRMSGRAT